MRLSAPAALWAALALLAAPAPAAPAAPAEAECLAPGGESVTLEGRVTLRTFPGPPFFSSVARGDAAEREFMLLLDEPLCVAAPAARAGLRELHVLLSSDIELQALSNLERRVWLSGQLVPGSTRRHRTPVLLRAHRLGALPERAPPPPAPPR
ncbi:MAG: hypothetical protein OXU78_04565 [Deltaproteobacteria bacterium]|nr:hypothetical protein [Deltaproteobacteria bacterium]MDD9853211.1 hypothetical protein [Deltaproteobacteria bacterium]MDD9872103.1 hypothetical protein [Deltaproteobacteria bacterium]